MLRAIAVKEFFDNLLNLRFSVGLLVTVILTVTSVIIQTQFYTTRMQNFHTDSEQQDAFIEKNGPTSSFFNETPLLPPEPLRIVANGISTDSDISFDASFVHAIFPYIDLVFIVSIILSLLGLLFSYDSICGERESGTLKLICSNTISRATILLGKWIGGTASLLIPFVISIMFAALYIELAPGVRWQPVDWASFGALSVASMVFISLFYLMGMMVSAFSRSSSVSILKAILLWIIIVLVVPNLGPYISTELYPIPSLVRLNKEYEQIMEDSRNQAGFVKKMMELRTALNRKYEEQYGDLFHEYKAIPREELLDRTGMEAPDSDLKAMGLAYRREWRDISRQVYEPIMEALRKTEDQIRLEQERQTEMAQNIAAISPYADYLYLASNLAGTGMASRENVKRAIEEFDEIKNKYSEEKMAEKDRKRISAWKNMVNDPFDISDRPRFSYQEEPVTARIAVSLPYLGVILLYGVLFFAIAFVGFIRYDVR